MRERLIVHRALIAAAALFAVTPFAFAQSDAQIAGVARDASGSVLPGVAVVATSPSLIEHSRTVFTDGQGQYRVISLVPGEYKVTFTLSGFDTLVREGIKLTAAFTATLNVEMSVGALEESLTVTGQSPLIDTQTVTQRETIPKELLDSLPSARTFHFYATLVPGVQMALANYDAGGTDGSRFQFMKIHGSRQDQMPLLLNGMRFNTMLNTGGGNNTTLTLNTGTIGEITVETSGTSAEAYVSGVVANSVTKEGSNRFSVYAYADGSSPSLQSDNNSQQYINEGVTAVGKIKNLYEVNATFGGPIVKDRFWFLAGIRDSESTKYLPGVYASKDPTSNVYCGIAAGCTSLNGQLIPDSRDLSRQAFSGNTYDRGYTANLTLQATPKNKFTFFIHANDRYLINDASVTATPEATFYQTSSPDRIMQGTWTAPLTSRLLLEGGISNYKQVLVGGQQNFAGLVGQGSDLIVGKRESSTGTTYGPTTALLSWNNNQYNMRFNVNYVTGTHSFKIGMQDMWGTKDNSINANQSQQWTMFKQVPSSITELARPLLDVETLKAALGIYAEDRWALRDVTFNLGVRFEYLNAYVPAQSIPASMFVPAESYPEVLNAPDWKDISPRLGVAWNLWGKGKTVVRANYGRYMGSESTSTATANNPVNTRINSATRSWTDANGNFIPDCNLANAAANGECGTLSAPLGAPNIVTHWSSGVLNGWGVRPHDDEFLVGVKQELHEGLSLDVQWTRHSFGNFFATQNLAQPPSGFDTFCLTMPTDSRLPNSGQQMCGFTELKPAFFGLTPNNYVTAANDIGNVVDVYTGVDVNLMARIHGATISGGVSVGRERYNVCGILGSASIGSTATSGSLGLIGETNATSYPSTLFCNDVPPYSPDWKMLANYPLPWWDLVASGTYQNRQGPEIDATSTFTVGQTNLGRPFVEGNTITRSILQPGTEYGPRIQQMDVRLSKVFHLGNRGRVTAHVSGYNMLNSNATLAWNTTYGPTWLVPTRIMPGRIIKFGTQVDF
jgi:hypothetical protein